MFEVYEPLRANIDFRASMPAVRRRSSDISELELGDSLVIHVQARFCANPTFLEITKELPILRFP
jgi:hypothetical protein